MNSAPKKVLDELLLPEKIVFHIPLYQRTYAWGKPKNRPKLENFLGIIRDVFDEVKDGVAPSERFIGFMVNLLPQRPAGLNSNTEMTVVDGQQRITTISLIICALVDSLFEKAEKFPDPNSREARALVTKANDFMRYYLLVDRNSDFERSNLTEAQLKLVPSNLNKKDYLDVVCGKGAAAEGTIGSAYSYIRKSLNKLEKDYYDSQAGYEAAVKEALNLLIVVNLEIGNPTEAQAIFENINYKNEPLTPYDLIRNRAFMNMPPALQRQIYEGVWQEMEKRYKKKFVSAEGEDAEESIDHENELLSFVRCDLARGGEKVSKKQIYQAFLNRYMHKPCLDREDIVLLAEQSRIYLFLKEADWCINNARAFGEPAPLFFQGMTPVDRRRLKKNLDDLKYLKITSVLTLLMAVVNKPGATLSELVEASEFFVSFFVRHAFSGGSTQRLSSHFDTLCAEFSSKSFDDIRQAGGMKQWMKLGMGDLYPDDRKISDWIKVSPVYGEIDSKYIKYVLFELCRRPQGSVELDGIDIDSYSIDHVMCQNLSVEWKEYLARRGCDTRPEYFAKKVHLLGNLALASGAIAGHEAGRNPAWGDRIYPEKAAEMELVALATTNEIPKHFASKSESGTWRSWAYDQIDARNLSLIERILNTWTI